MKSILGMFTALALSTCAAVAPVIAAEEVCQNPISHVLVQAEQSKLTVIDITDAEKLKEVLEFINSTGPGGFAYEPHTVRLIIVLSVANTPRGEIGLFIEANAKDCATFMTPAPNEMLKKLANFISGRNV